MSERFGSWANGLGDQWAVVNHCFWKSAGTQKPIKLCDYCHNPNNTFKYRKGRIREIVSLIDGPGEIEVIDEFPDNVMQPILLGVTYYPTKIRWQPNVSKRICYAPTCHTMGCYSPPAEQLEKVLNHVRMAGYEAVELNGEMSLAEVVSTMASCESYVGQSTGFTHMAHSVGIPVYLVIKYEKKEEITQYHLGKAYTLCNDWDDFLLKWRISILGCRSR